MASSLPSSMPVPGGRSLRELTIDLHLCQLPELVSVDDFDPFAPDAPTHSGVQEIKAAALDMKMPDRINVILYLPTQELPTHESIGGAASTITEALKRYCAYQDREVEASITALKRKAIDELRVGGVVLANVVALSLLLSPLLTSEGAIASALGALVGGACYRSVGRGLVAYRNVLR